MKLKTSSGAVLRLVQCFFTLELDTKSEIVPFIRSNVENNHISQIGQNDRRVRSTHIKEQALKTFGKTRLGRKVHLP